MTNFDTEQVEEMEIRYAALTLEEDAWRRSKNQRSTLNACGNDFLIHRNKEMRRIEKIIKNVNSKTIHLPN